MVYLVTWNINKGGNEYIEARTRFLTGFVGLDSIPSGLDTVYFVNTEMSAEELYRALNRNLDTSDRIFVCEIDSDKQYGWINQDVVDWLRARW